MPAAPIRFGSRHPHRISRPIHVVPPEREQFCHPGPDPQVKSHGQRPPEMIWRVSHDPFQGLHGQGDVLLRLFGGVPSDQRIDCCQAVLDPMAEDGAQVAEVAVYRMSAAALGFQLADNDNAFVVLDFIDRLVAQKWDKQRVDHVRRRAIWH